MSQTQKTENINDSYFDGYYKDIWRAVIPDELTTKEAEFMIRYFDLKPGDKVLDIMCGYGRHALALARNGIVATAVDNLHEYISEIKQVSELEHLPLSAIETNVLEFKAEEFFKLAICMGNSLNFFDVAHAKQLMQNIYSYLSPGGHFLINTWTLAEIAIKHFRDRYWSDINGIRFLTESRFLFHPTRVETESIMIASDGKTERKIGIDYIFSLSEMETMLNESGFILEDVYSIPGKKKFAIGDARAYIIARKS